jgi:hypothetical protein
MVQLMKNNSKGARILGRANKSVKPLLRAKEYIMVAIS